MLRLRDWSGDENAPVLVFEQLPFSRLRGRLRSLEMDALRLGAGRAKRVISGVFGEFACNARADGGRWESYESANVISSVELPSLSCTKRFALLKCR